MATSPTDAFYDACDELGILLYHDMMYAQQGHSPKNTTTQEAEIRHQVRACVRVHKEACCLGAEAVTLSLPPQVRRLSHHPSIAIWDACNECGGQGIYGAFVMATVSQVCWWRSPPVVAVGALLH